jgi:hypothetical protein
MADAPVKQAAETVKKVVEKTETLQKNMERVAKTGGLLTGFGALLLAVKKIYDHIK